MLCGFGDLELAGPWLSKWDECMLCTDKGTLGWCLSLSSLRSWLLVEISQNERRRKDDQVRATIMQKLVETGEKER